jgi:tetratricopeptide (TPR) repeat protein
MKILCLCMTLLWPTVLQADDCVPPLNPLTAKAVIESNAGQNEAACADAKAALAARAVDKCAFGIAKLTCVFMPNRDIKPIKQGPDKEDDNNLQPDPLKGKPNGPQIQQQPPAEKNISQVVGAVPNGPSFQDQPTSYDKTVESQSLLSQGKLAEAADAARLAVELQPNNRRAFDAWAEATRQLRNYDQALAIAERGLQAFPNDLDLLRNKIFALNKKKDYKAAIAAADQALGFYTTDATLLALKAYALGCSGDHDGMVKAMETAFAFDPSFESLLNDARGSKGGEPFLMPGDTRAAPRKGIPAPRKSGSMTGFIIFSWLIALLVIGALLAVTGVFKRGEAEVAPGPDESSEPPASPPADPPELP